MLSGVLCAALALATGGLPQQGGLSVRAQEVPRFRSSVDLVSVAAVVRDRRGRFVTDLSRHDFEILEAGVPRDILDFRAELNGPIRLALVIDVSGSMRLGQNMQDAVRAARAFFAGLQPADEGAVYTFDSKLRQAQPFTTDPAALDSALLRLDEPFGQTSLYDAIGQTARIVASTAASGRPGIPERSAVVVLTDGIDTRSLTTAHEVSIAASGIDVPVYVVSVLSGIDDPRAPHNRRQAAVTSDLRELARATGGELFFAGTEAEASATAEQILSELRHQYVLAFEASERSGWRPLEVRTRQRGMSVRARTGYRAGDVPESG